VSGDGARIVVVGEALVDIVHRASGAVDETPGGSPANVALTLGRLDREPVLVTRLGRDERGDLLRRWLDQSGVEVRGVDAARTATATAHLDASGAATYEFDLDWSLGDDLSRLRGLVGEAELLHVGSIATVIDPGAVQVAALVRAARPHALVTYDPNIRPSLVDEPAAVRARVEELVALADVVKASDEDLRWLHPGDDLVEAARRWAALGPAFVIVTLGADGAFAVTATSDVVSVPGVATDVVDTVGAGDTFMGALIDGLLAVGATGPGLRAAEGGGIHLSQLEAILRHGAHAAAITVARAGANPPWRAELATAV
jgi:fructokinase